MTLNDIKVGSIFKMYDENGTLEWEVVGVEENLYSFEIHLNAAGFLNRPKTIFWPKMIDGYKLEYANGETYELIKNE